MNPHIARRIAYHKVFDRTEILEFWDDTCDDWNLGTIDDEVYESSIRSVKSRPVEPVGILFEKLKTYVWAANQTFWNFELTGLSPHDPPQILCYSPGDHYDWHIDYDGQSSTRKLTCIVQLSDADSYSGGDVCVFPSLKHSQPTDWRACGTLIIFPVYVPHCVAKIESGLRNALVFWVHGPEFR